MMPNMQPRPRTVATCLAASLAIRILTPDMEMKDGSLAGHITDQFGFMSQSPIFEVKLEESIFSFSVIISGPSGKEATMVLKMNVEKDSMKGTLEIPDIEMNGTWEATKQK